VLWSRFQSMVRVAIVRQCCNLVLRVSQNALLATPQMVLPNACVEIFPTRHASQTLAMLARLQRMVTLEIARLFCSPVILVSQLATKGTLQATPPPAGSATSPRPAACQISAMKLPCWMQCPCMARLGTALRFSRMEEIVNQLAMMVIVRVRCWNVASAAYPL